ncbi:DUF805 domain-containing protein [Metabacillus fastidiosus]|uniref:DUF805 domain-containing protein n=1 Tax=Metabacillus fastidiosus TaxID=1458 RepID=UPI002DB7CA8F|nr:DUF805 domain-containing protein [Metabacillus fastidiosus]MEC2076568.1 DUF805 domain-containing protein [Metabacillus fastidiosus]
MKWYLKAFQKYAIFKGRARRKEFWMFFLINFIILLVFTIIQEVADIPFLAAVYFLASMLPTLALSVRRLHDIGRSGWWILIYYVPFGSIVLLVFACLDSEEGDNQYGVNAKVSA